MSHLSDIELVDVIEDRHEARLAAHVADCTACRERVAELRGVLLATRELDAPEPSPLFWDLFSERLRARLSREPASSRGWRSLWDHQFGHLGRLGAATAVGLTVAFLLVVVPNGELWRGAGSPDGSVDGLPRTLDGDQRAASPMLPPDGGAEWMLLVLVTDGMSWDEAGEVGLGVGPGLVEGAVEQLSAGERRRLAELLRAELDATQS